MRPRSPGQAGRTAASSSGFSGDNASAVIKPWWRIGGPVEGIPSSYFIDAQGIVRARVFGPMDEERLEEELAKVLE